MENKQKKPRVAKKPETIKEKKYKKPHKWKPEFCEALIKHMAKGYSYTTFSLEANVTSTTLYEWEKSYPEFAEAKVEAFDAAKKFFEDRLMAKIDAGPASINAKNIDTTCLIFALKTRFHKEYGDKSKQELDVTSDGKPIKIVYANDAD